MGNFLSQFNGLVNRDGDSNVPDVQLDFESKCIALRFQRFQLSMAFTNPMLLCRLIHVRRGCRVILECAPYARAHCGSAGAAPNLRGLWRIYSPGKRKNNITQSHSITPFVVVISYQNSTLLIIVLKFLGHPKKKQTIQLQHAHYAVLDIKQIGMWFFFSLLCFVVVF